MTPPPSISNVGSNSPYPTRSGLKAQADLKKSAAEKEDKHDKGKNWTVGGVEEHAGFFALLILAPFLCQWCALLTSANGPASIHLSDLLSTFVADPVGSLQNMFMTVVEVPPTMEALNFLLIFTGVALILEVVLPGRVEYGPETRTGHIPAYVDNGVLHCIVYSALFVGCSNLGLFNLFDFGIMFDVFSPAISILNIFGLLFCLFLYFKGIYWPSTQDSGSSGSFIKDFTWGTELYPRIFGVDVKRFINCRFSMTFWMLAGLSFAYRSYTIHGVIDYGLLLSAVSQYMYLCKFFMWEMGYMSSIDIILDRAGMETQWGCLVFVPSVYTFHTRILVLHPSGLSPLAAGAIFSIGFLGVFLNYTADMERQNFRKSGGKMKIWGKEPVYVEASYQVVNKDGKMETRTSLLLASGFWGIARHFHYAFELTAAYSWCLLANPLVNGFAPFLYAAFLTCLLVSRAKRDELKCSTKYGKDYDKYSEIVPYLIIPGVY